MFYSFEMTFIKIEWILDVLWHGAKINDDRIENNLRDVT